MKDHRTGSRSRAEQETIVRFDRASDEAVLWTADLGMARRWVKKGYAVADMPGGWRCTVPKRFLTFRSAQPRIPRTILAADGILAAVAGDGA